MGTSRISVIIPLFNMEKYLSQCLNSVLRQSFEDYEVICVNDGSTDRTLEILKTFAEKDKRIHIILQENSGLSCARNTGISLAEGKYICFLDGDDLLVEDALKSIYELVMNEELDILCFDARLCYKDSRLSVTDFRSSYYAKSREYGGIKRGMDMFYEMIENNDYCDSACLLCINRKWLNDHKILFYPGIYYEDVLFCFQCYMEAKRMYHVKRDYYVYQVREGSTMTSSFSYIKLYSYLFCYKEIRKMLLRNDYEERVSRAIRTYLLLILSNIREAQLALETDGIRTAQDELSPIDEFILNTVKSNQISSFGNNPFMYLTGIVSELEKARRIVLYGAGKAGMVVYQYLKNIGLDNKIMCFAVSDTSHNATQMGVPVNNISEIKCQTRVCILIATIRTDYQKEMVSKAERLGFREYLIIDNQLMNLMRCQLEQAWRDNGEA